MKRGALALLVISLSAIAFAYAAAIVTGGMASWSAWVMAIATPLSMVAVIALGAARSGQRLDGLRRLVLPLVAVLAIMLAAFAAALLLPGVTEPLIFGLPRRAAIVLYGIGLLPALILPIAYALTFDDLTLTEEDIERVRAAADSSSDQAVS